MNEKYYTSVQYSCFANFGFDMIFRITLCLPYKYRVALARTCQYMHVVVKLACAQEETNIRSSAIQRMSDILDELGYLGKLQELNQKYPILLAGDFVLSHITSINFKSQYIDVYIGNDPPFDQMTMVEYLMELFIPKNDTTPSIFMRCKLQNKFGCPTIYFSRNHLYPKRQMLALHMNCGSEMWRYIESKFDLTCSMVCSDLKEIYTERFWQQVSGIGYLNNTYYMDETARRIIRLVDTYHFDIIDAQDFEWSLYNFQYRVGHNPYA